MVVQRGLVKHISMLVFCFLCTFAPFILLPHIVFVKGNRILLHVCAFGLALAACAELSFRRVCVSVSCVEALNEYEVSGCGFDPNERSNNFKTGFVQRSERLFICSVRSWFCHFEVLLSSY